METVHVSYDVRPTRIAFAVPKPDPTSVCVSLLQILHNLGVRLRWLVLVGVRQLENNWSSRWARVGDGLMIHRSVVRIHPGPPIQRRTFSEVFFASATTPEPASDAGFGHMEASTRLPAKAQQTAPRAVLVKSYLSPNMGF